jgi:hypothetical protein
MTIETYEQKRQAHAMRVQSMFAPEPPRPPRPKTPAPGTLVRSPDRPEWGAITSREAEARTGMSHHEIRRAARMCWKCGGLRWHIDGREYSPQRQRRPGHQVRCVETGNEFLSMQAAARWAARKTGRSPLYLGSVQWSVTTGKPISGLHFVRLADVNESERS